MFTVEIHATSHVGRVRKGNEDNYLLLNISRRKPGPVRRTTANLSSNRRNSTSMTNGVVLAVSDGMGGALAGEVASKLAVETRLRKAASDDDDRRDADAEDVRAPA